MMNSLMCTCAKQLFTLTFETHQPCNCTWLLDKLGIDGISEQKVGDILWNVLLQLDVVYIKMEKGRVCLCTNTPGDSNNNAAVLGSHRAARAVRPFVSRGHSLHYNPKDKVPSGGTESHEGSGIVPHSMHTSVFSQTCYTLFRDEQSF